jgi:hypothetical protein
MAGRWGSLGWLAIALTAVASTVGAQSGDNVGMHGGHDHGSIGGNPDLHVSSRWRECSFQLDPSLTQAAWRQFTGEAGVVTKFRPLIGAEPMGAGKFEVSVLNWKTGIDDSEDAWNDTFVHPDSSHWLFEGSGLSFPGLAVRAGVTDRTDVGVYFTKSPGANYGFYGAQLQHALIHDPAKKWSVASRVSFVSMYGPEDLDFRVYGLDLVGSTKYRLLSFATVSPYLGLSGSLSTSHEKSSVVDLEDENVLGMEATFGAALQVSVASIAVEYMVAEFRHSRSRWPSVDGSCLPYERDAGQLTERAERRLRRVEPESEILVAIRGVQVRRPVPVRAPPRTDLRPALVLAQTDRRHDFLEGRGVGVRHVLADARRIVGGESLVGGREDPGELPRAGGHLRVTLELDVHVGLGALLGT